MTYQNHFDGALSTFKEVLCDICGSSAEETAQFPIETYLSVLSAKGGKDDHPSRAAAVD
jgi:hypothetical protein